jgi:Permuted papain-like amidase enzyme, YaeF/YiiX, C92 family
MIWKDPKLAKIVLLTLVAVLGYGATMLGPPEFHDGDLIFQETAGQQSAAVLAATGSPYTHMGIVRLRGDKQVVVEAIGPVQETPLEAWISRGEGGRYALYRLRDLSPSDATRVLLAAERYYGRPYDILFRPEDDAIYCSELPHLAFSAIGKELGEMKALRSLNIDDSAVSALIARRWQQHPACSGTTTMGECVQIIKDQPIVTPASIAADRDVELIYSDF